VPRSRALFALLLAAASACTSSPGVGCAPERILREGDRLPDCTLESLDGTGEVKLSSLTGSATLLNFWASWCIACLQEMPTIDAYATAHREVRVLGIDVADVNGETVEAARRYFAERGVSYESLVDFGGRLYGHFGSAVRPTMPLTVVLDADGVIAARHFGELDAEGLDALVSDALR
jgi:thiol-disulfide isomerase/thioredoxin